MEDTINKRVRQVRMALELKQRDFCQLLSLSHGYIAGIETGAREVNGRLIKLIVSEFDVSEEWLKTGVGEMFGSPKVDEKSAKLVSLFNDLPPDYKEALFGIIDILRNLRDKEEVTPAILNLTTREEGNLPQGALAPSVPQTSRKS